MQPLKLAISPCPNDTFAWEALVHNRLPGNLVQFSEVRLLDIQELNDLAHTEWPDVIKVSFMAYAGLQHTYQHLTSGAALGRGVGPLLVRKAGMPAVPLERARIALPGWNTTAHLLLHHFAPQATKRSVVRFDHIMDAVQHGDADCGVLIHEGRFTYADHGLHLVQDLGQHWEHTTGRTIPLGGIVARRQLGTEAIAALSDALRASIQYAWAHPAVVQLWVQQHAQELAPAVQQQHIALYVNHFTEDLGPEGEADLQFFLEQARGLLQPLAGLAGSERAL